MFYGRRAIIFEGKSKITRNFDISLPTLFILIFDPLFIVTLPWPCYKSLILIPRFVSLFLQIDRDRFIRSSHQKGITSNDPISVVDHFEFFNSFVDIPLRQDTVPVLCRKSLMDFDFRYTFRG